MPRLFVAIDLPGPQRTGLASICRGLPPGTRWTPPEQLHLTLRFIGEVDDRLFLLIKDKLADLSFTPFSLQIQGLGHFPPRRHPKILWAGVAENPDLCQLQSRIERCLVELGLVPEDRPFHPHLTIARLPLKLSPQSLAAYLAQNSQTASTPFLVDTFHLYSSLLTRKGALHRIEGSFPVS